MDKKQAREMIQDIFSSAFDRERYTAFLRNLLNTVESRDVQYTGNLVPEAYRDHVNQYWRIGKYTDPDGNELDLLVVEIKTLTKLERARSALRNFAINRLKKFEKEASLIAFYAKDDSGADWRFSYVKIEHEAFKDEKGKVKLKPELTPAKRYSYLVGEHENSHTAQAQLVDLLAMDYANPTVEEVEKAFSIEKVTKEFFEQYKDLFVHLSEVLAAQPYFQQEADPEKRKQIVAKFAKKLLGQIVFLYFLQKKGWMGVDKEGEWGKGERRFLQALFAAADKARQNYYVEKLQFLFYEALANDRKDQFDPSYYQRFDCRIPFLNGGLFEADYDWQKIRVEIPNSVFSNNDRGKSGDIGTGILDVFDRYNFTIREDEPLDKEIAVDPEMLDDVFIGLDIANRLPQLTILENDFPEYQVFITTYDKPWFEHARGFLEPNANWKTIEFYAQTSADGTDTPLIVDNKDSIAKAEIHLNQCDYKAAAVCARSAFEKLIRKHCEKKRKAVTFKSRLKD